MAELAHIEKIVFLQSVGLFSFCRAEEILRLANITHERQVDAGEKLYDVNDPADVFFCVVSGQITLEGSDGESAQALPHQTFGDLEILRGRLRSSSATAAMDSLLLAIDAEDFFDLLGNNIEIVKAIFRRILEGGPDNPPQGG